MAEIVEYRVERTLDELNLLVDFGLFTEAQAKKVTSDRQNFEYKLRRRTRNKLDFLEYIRYELNLLESIDQYRKTVIKDYYKQKHNKEDDELGRRILLLQAKKLNDIVRSRSAHVSSLFRKLTTTFQFDKMLWMAYIDFAISRKWNTRVTALYWRLLRVASDDPTIWIAAARHEIEVNKAYDSARGLYLRALRHHPRSNTLWANYFKMELGFMDIVVQRARVIFKKPKDKEETRPEDIWVGDDEDGDEQKELEQDGEKDVDETIFTETSSKQEDDIVPLVNPIDQDDLITSGHLPKLVYDNAVKSPMCADEFNKFTIDIINYMFMTYTQFSKGLQSVKEHVAAGLKRLFEERDGRVSEELATQCDSVDFIRRQHEQHFGTEGIDKKLSPTKRRKIGQSKLEVLRKSYETDGLTRTRQKFESMEKSITNRTLSLYVGMIQIESEQLEKDKSKQQLDRIRSIYNKAIAKYGKSKLKLWCEYIKFELALAKDLEDVDRINRLYEQAQKTLDPSKVNQLIERYTLLRDKNSKAQLEHSDYSDLDE